MAARALCAVLLLSLAGCGGGTRPSPHAPAVPRAAVVSEHRAGPRLVDLRVRSPALKRVASVRLRTPAGWRPDATRTWPVLYLLHGCCDTYRSWSQATDIARLERLRPGGD